MKNRICDQSKNRICDPNDTEWIAEALRKVAKNKRYRKYIHKKYWPK